MPTYDYKCRACGHEFEELQSITAQYLKKCPKCRKLKLKRLIGTGAGIIFKGSGFYETDYKRKPEPKTEDKQKETKMEEKPKETKSDDKPKESKKEEPKSSDSGKEKKSA